MADAEPDTTRCPLCGGPNGCVPANARIGACAPGPCWCDTARIAPEVLAAIPQRYQRVACICPACAAAGPDPTPRADRTGQ